MMYLCGAGGGAGTMGVETDVIFDSCHRSSLDVKILKINPQCIVLHQAFKLRGKLCRSMFEIFKGQVLMFH